jgi:hypothetical protein
MEYKIIDVKPMREIKLALTFTAAAIGQQPVARVTGTDICALSVGTDMFTEMRTIVAFVDL